MQPFVSGEDVCVCNGELYGFREVRKYLASIGYRFTSDSDCEIILPLWKEYGTKMFNMLDAEFAMIIYDAREDRYIAARDPIGIRPLYYGYVRQKYIDDASTFGLAKGSGKDRGIVFASEPKNLAGLVKEIYPFPPGYYYMITGMWRASGIITFFVYYGIKIITPHLFILVAFLLSALLSYALGTSFGVAGTLGVIFITLAKSGDVNLAIAGGAILSGIYFGDRGSPVSSSAALTAAITHTDLAKNVREMMHSAILPMAICTAAYGVLSYMNPIRHVRLDDNSVSRTDNIFEASEIFDDPVYRFSDILEIITARFSNRYC